MIGFSVCPKRAAHLSKSPCRRLTKRRTKEWTIEQDVQAYCSNRLVVLHFHGVVLSDKVKANLVSCRIRICMVKI